MVLFEMFIVLLFGKHVTMIKRYAIIYIRDYEGASYFRTDVSIVYLDDVSKPVALLMLLYTVAILSSIYFLWDRRQRYTLGLWP